MPRTLPLTATSHELDAIYDHLRTRLSTSRFHHTLGVAFTSVALARTTAVDPARALLAALLHDIGKEEDRSEQRARAIEAGYFNPEDEDFPAIWHASAAAALAREEYHVCDEDVLRAIQTHSTCDHPASPLQRILFLADYIEPGRCYDGTADLRRLAREKPDDAFRKAVLTKTDHLKVQGRPLHPRSARARLHALQEAHTDGRGDTNID